MMLRVLAFACGILSGGAAVAECRIALVLALDVSGSVNGDEYRLQVDGVANALTHPEIVEALLAMPGANVALNVFEWSGPRYHRRLLDWSELASEADIAAAANRLRLMQRLPADPSTAIGNAMAYAASELLRGPDCARSVVNISGDGKSNNGPQPNDVVLLPHVMVNALVIGGELIDAAEYRHVNIAELSAYFRANVLRGPEAFVETAAGFSEFEEAMIRKLKRELQVFAVSDLRPLRNQ